MCNSFEPISFSAKFDSKVTINQIRAHNEALATYNCDHLDVPLK